MLEWWRWGGDTRRVAMGHTGMVALRVVTLRVVALGHISMEALGHTGLVTP